MDSRFRNGVVSDSFRREYAARPAGFRTPPPPSASVEPLSPVLLPAKFIDHGFHERKRRRYEEPDSYKSRLGRPSSSGRKESDMTNSPAAASPPSRSSHSHPATYYRSQLSPTALDVFAAVATSPDLAQGGFSPSANGHSPWSQPQNSGQIARGSKRSHSEVINWRPQQQDNARPSTSYAGGWGSTYKQPNGGIDAKEPNQAVSGHGHRDSNHSPVAAPVADSRFEDAELLLGFALGGGHQSFQPRHDMTHISPSFAKIEDRHHDQDSWARKHAQGFQDDLRDPRGRLVTSDEISMSSKFPLGARHGDLNGAVPGRAGLNKDLAGVGRADNIAGNSALHTWPVTEAPQEPPKKPRVHKGWPKGKPRGKRANVANPPQNKKSTTKKATRAEKSQQSQRSQKPLPLKTLLSAAFEDYSLPPRPKSALGHRTGFIASSKPVSQERASSVPLEVSMIGPRPESQRPNVKSEVKLSLCAFCQQTNSPNGYNELWITCNGCKKWFHTVCAGFKSEREVRDVDRFYCVDCEAEHGKTTFVRKSSRAHASVDYAGLNEGQIRTSVDTFEHHFIQPIKDGTFEFLPEKFARMPPELVTAEFFERSGTMSEPVLIPASMNHRPDVPAPQFDAVSALGEDEDSFGESKSHLFMDDYEYDCVPDDGQDKLDMVMPKGLTVRHVAQMLGPERPLQVIDVKSQDQGDTTWNLGKWADYYETPGEKPVRNVISLEVSQTRLSRLIRRPKIVRDLDLQDHVLPQDDLDKGKYPQVQFYCLMSVADCYTDFHIDFGGSSVYYHILRGKKTFFFIPPKKQHLKKYEEWCVSPDQESVFLGNVTKECYRVDLSEGDTMLIPSGWIHAVWTPENSLVIGGNFLTRMHYGMQIQINEIEKNTGVARMFRYPNFQKVLWYTVIQYLQDDPIPYSVAQKLYEGGKFERECPVYFDFEPFGLAEANDEHFNARYYSQGEIEGLTDLLGFVFRTVMVSLGLIPLPKGKQEAVIRSLPKGYGDHLELLKTFALWITWKRGNEELPVWAHSDAPISELEAAMAEKKINATTAKKAEPNRKRTTPERRSQRQTPKDKEAEAPEQASVLPADEDQDKAPSQSTQDTNRTWCESCRRSRVRCKHREPDDQLDTTERFGIKAPRAISLNLPAALLPNPEPDLVDEQATESSDVHLDAQTIAAKDTVFNSTPAPTPALAVQNGNPPTNGTGTQVRIKACEECRKSKRRCIHDADGNIDPIKAVQNPVPRAFSATKRIRLDRSTNGHPPAKKTKASPVDEESKTEGKYDEAPMIPEVTMQEAFLLDPDAPMPLSFGSSPIIPEGAIISNDTRSIEPQPDPPFSESSWIQRQAVSPISHPDESKVSCHESLQSGDVYEQSPQNHNPNGDLESPLDNVVEQIKPFDHPLTTSENPNNHSGSENRSRTSSVHIQTNSTESLERSRSPPTSPLTEVEPSSPIQPKQEEGLDDAPQMHLVPPRQAAGSNKRSKGLVVLKVDTTSPRTPLKIKEQVPSRSSIVTSRRSAPRRSNGSRSVSIDVGGVGNSGTPGRATSVKSQAMSPTEETIEDESMRLVRQLQEQEFGLRRRSK